MKFHLKFNATIYILLGIIIGLFAHAAVTTISAQVSDTIRA
jgi:hypothetical protein